MSLLLLLLLHEIMGNVYCHGIIFGEITQSMPVSGALDPTLCIFSVPR